MITITILESGLVLVEDAKGNVLLLPEESQAATLSEIIIVFQKAKETYNNFIRSFYCDN